MLDLVAIRECLGCGSPDVDASPLCADCAPQLRPGLVPLATRRTLFAHAWATGTYAGPVGALVRRTKFQLDQRACTLLVRLLRESVAPGLPFQPSAIVPVPTTPWRLLARGIHLPEILAEVLAERTGAPLVWGLRRRWGLPQAERTFAERLAAGPDLFAPAAPVSGHVLLVDDVLTSGASLHAAAAELLAAGATSVSGLVLAAAGPLRRVPVGHS